jgi:hypothetical protein
MIVKVARFFFVQHTKTGKMYQTGGKCTKWPENMPNGRKIDHGHELYQHLRLQDPPKFTQIGIFGSRRNHLATLMIVGSISN